MTNEEVIKILEVHSWGVTDSKYAEAVDKAKKAIAALKSKPEWIPATERLPEGNEDSVLATIHKSAVTMLNVTLDSHGEREWWDGDPCDGWLYHDSDIRAWMPLPEPYREVEE